MKISVKFKGAEFDLTKFVLPGTLSIRQTIDGTFDTGSFVIPNIKGDEFEVLDMSRPLPRYADCEIEYQGVYYNLLIADCEVKENRGRYEHQVNLISRSKILEKCTLPDITVTQQSQDVNLSSSAQNKISNARETMKYHLVVVTEQTAGDFYPINGGSGVRVADIKGLTFANQTPPNEYINGMQLLKANTNYTISLDLSVLNFQADWETKTAGIQTGTATNAATTLKVIMYVNGVSQGVVREQTISGGVADMVRNVFGTPQMPTGYVNPNEKTVFITLLHKTVSANEVISFSVETVGEYTSWTLLSDPVNYRDLLYLTDATVHISANHSTEFEYERMDGFMEKAISLAEYPLQLDETSKAKLNAFIAPEMTLQSYDFWKLCLYVGSVTGSIPRLKYDRLLGIDVLHFDFYDDLEAVEPQDFANIQSYVKKTTLDGYMSAVELNADSILKNNKGGVLVGEVYRSGSADTPAFTGLRASTRGQAQITTNNLAIHTPFPIDKIYKVIVRGYPVVLGTGELVYPATTEWDITSRVLPKEHWEVLPGQADTTAAARSAGALSSNTTLYYTQGQHDILGLSTTGTLEPKLKDDKKNRALYEVIYILATKELAAAGDARWEQLKKEHDDGAVSQDEQIGVYVEYEPYVSTRARIYKEDQSGFEKPVISFFNENARVNDAYALGAYAQGEVNRSSNTVAEVKGMCGLAAVPPVGSKNKDGYVLTEVHLGIPALPENRVSYYGKYSKDFSVLSEYTGIRSEFRIYEVPSTNIVVSNRKREKKIWFSDKQLSGLLDSDQEFYIHLSPMFSATGVIAGSAPLVARFKPDTSAKEHILIVDSAAYGNCISWTVRAWDNYSTGSRRQAVSISGEPTVYQLDSRYTDDFGRMNSFDLRLGRSWRTISGADENALNETLLSDYPVNEMGRTFQSNILQLLNVPYPKDAREIFSYSINHIFLSDSSDKVFIYNAFTKYSRRARAKPTTGNIMCAIADYVPSKSATQVNRGKIRADVVDVGIVSVASTPPVRYVEMRPPTDDPVGSPKKGYVFYHNETGEILIFFKTAENGNVRMYVGEKE